MVFPFWSLYKNVLLMDLKFWNFRIFSEYDDHKPQLTKRSPYRYFSKFWLAYLHALSNTEMESWYNYLVDYSLKIAAWLRLFVDSLQDSELRGRVICFPCIRVSFENRQNCLIKWSLCLQTTSKCITDVVSYLFCVNFS